jgi:hypothetical protein
MSKYKIDYTLPLSDAVHLFKELTGEEFDRTTIIGWATPRDNHKHPGGRVSRTTGERVYLKTLFKMGKRYTTVEWIKHFISSLG